MKSLDLIQFLLQGSIPFVLHHSYNAQKGRETNFIDLIQFLIQGSILFVRY